GITPALAAARSDLQSKVYNPGGSSPWRDAVSCRPRGLAGGASALFRAALDRGSPRVASRRSTMTRASAGALALMAAVTVTACADNILKERPVNSAAKPTAAAAPKFAVTTKGQSSVCAAYRRQLAQVKREEGMAALNPHAYDLQKLQAKELSLNAVIADACE